MYIALMWQLQIFSRVAKSPKAALGLETGYPLNFIHNGLNVTQIHSGVFILYPKKHIALWTAASQKTHTERESFIWAPSRISQKLVQYVTVFNLRENLSGPMVHTF